MMSMTEMTDCIVIGAGASGMMCAGKCAERGKSVLLIEKNNICGKKLYITGKGRCNVTNRCSTEEFFENVVSNPKFLYGAYRNFDSAAVMGFFEEHGVPLKVERGNRVFPVSDKAADIVSALEKYCSGADKVRGSVSRINVSDGKVQGVTLSDGRTFLSEKVVVATGGASYPVTGSDGSGYMLAAEVGHKIITPTPSLVPVEVSEIQICKALQGLTLKNVSVRVLRGNKTVYSDFGELLFTHFGISGPVVLSASTVALPGDVFVIDMKPALDEQALDERILSDFAEYSNRDLINAIGDLLPSKMIPVAVSVADIDPRKKVNAVTKTERRRFLETLKRFTLTVSALRSFKEAVVTRGGVDVREVSPSDMQSKKIKGLYFCGEVLDVDAYTGGFNLQIAFSTAVKAAENI